MNLVAAAEFVFAALVGLVAWWLSGKNDTVALFTAGSLLLSIDLGLRWQRRVQIGAPLGWLYGRTNGGVLLIFPMWAIGVVQLGVAVARSLGIAV